MFPIIIYDFSHGFKQTIIFLGWTLYKPFSFFIKHSSGSFLANFGVVLNFLLQHLQKTIFDLNLIIAVLIFILSLIYLFYITVKEFKIESSKFILLFLLLISFFGILINQTPSDAYLPVVLPFLILTITLFFEFFLNLKYVKYLILIILVTVIISNGYMSLNNNYGFTLNDRLTAVKEIINLTNHQKYNLVGRGQNSQFESFTMNYQYLLWWKGYAPSDARQKTKAYVSEDSNGIHVTVKKIDEFYEKNNCTYFSFRFCIILKTRDFKSNG